ncbi:FMN-binding protein [Streptosporangium sp. NPDC048047]|uniref:FMN-binding protein n=1 Tax=Streptosporangium sp. NPDC048047 TaxID=3155748 RepID=UPI0034457A50
MRRAIAAVLATAVGLVLLLSFKPHEVATTAQRPAAVSRDGSGTGAGSSGSGTGGDTDGGSRRSPGGFGRFGGDDDDDGFGGDRGGEGGGNGRTSADQGSWTGPGATAGAAAGDRTVAGDAADTRWGPVQVELVLSGGKMAGIKVLQAPMGNHRDIAINDEALPILNEAALSAQSADIDTVSGATYTSDGYIRSLQSALDKAGL